MCLMSVSLWVLSSFMKILGDEFPQVYPRGARVVGTVSKVTALAPLLKSSQVLMACVTFLSLAKSMWKIHVPS